MTKNVKCVARGQGEGCKAYKNAYCISQTPHECILTNMSALSPVKAQ